MKEERITRVTIEEARKLNDQTDWDRLENAEQAGLEPACDADFDDVEWNWENTTVVIPEPKKAISVRLDADVLEFFKSQGKGYQTRINAVLRSYMEAMRRG